MTVNLRRDARQRADATFTLTWKDEGGLARSVETRGIDSSHSGVGVHSPESLRLGLIVHLDGGRGRVRGLAAVRHCRASSGGYHVGLELSEEAKTTPATPEAEVDFYEFLQINPKSATEVVHRIYRYLAARYHPDNPATGDLEKFLLLNRAYEILSDPERRAQYDASRSERESKADPALQSRNLIDGVEGELNRRFAIIAVLYKRRRRMSDNPGLSMWELERMMSMPREHLEFATWYLKAKGYITTGDNSELILTVAGVDYVEANADRNMTLDRLLNVGSSATFSSERNNRRGAAEVLGLLGETTANRGD